VNRKHLEYLHHNNENKILELCFKTNDYDNDFKTILNLNSKLLLDQGIESWGQKTIRFFDPEDNIIELGETIPCFVKRLYDERLSVEEVAEKTGVAISLVKPYIAA
jgi:hypothetical protein